MIFRNRLRGDLPGKVSACNDHDAPGKGNPECGQAAVEFTLLIPLILILIVGALQVFLTINSYLIISSASREGARRCATTNDEDEGRRAALASLSPLSEDRLDIKVHFPGGRSTGKPVKVSVDYRVPMLLPGLSGILPELSISRSTIMHLERGP